MARSQLMIVESPTKAQKIRAILGAGWTVQACFGHIRDLPEREMGLIPPDFKPRYEILKRADEQVQRLKALAQTAECVYLATDPDREGEAIAWHLAMALRLRTPQRVTFNEITDKAVKAAVQAPRPLDLQQVAAQEARRALDRLVGYMVSPQLCRRMDAKLSAGRVQSPALRLVVDREREIEQFQSLAHCTVTLFFNGEGGTWWAHWLFKPLLKDGAEHWTDAVFAQKVAAVRTLRVEYCKDSERRAEPPAPFTTSTLQQAASAKLNMNPQTTMDVAQALFEQGLITYMRTDSPNLSADAIAEIRQYCQNQQLPVSAQPRKWSAKASAQEAHEAIRPTQVQQRSAGNTAQQRSLYQLIWARAVASQMAAAVYDQRQAVLQSAQPLEDITLRFGAKGERLKFAGWLGLTGGDAADESGYENRDNPVPLLQTGELLTASDGKLTERKTEPPRRYTQAGLVRALERLGIGRPSTYAAIMEGLARRGYVELRGKTMQPTPIAKTVIDALKPAFSFLAYEFTAQMEDQLDEIAQGRLQYSAVVSASYAVLMGEIAALPPIAGKPQVLIDLAAPPQTCPACGQAMRRIQGKHGWFWGCSQYRQGCRKTLPDSPPPLTDGD